MATSQKSCCNIATLKYLFHIYNLLLAVIGICALGLSIWSILWKKHYIDIQSTYIYLLLIYNIFAIGVVAIVSSLIGYVGVWRENRCTIAYYAIILIVIFISEATVVCGSFLYKRHVADEMNYSLNNTFITKYNVSEKQTAAIDIIQQQLRCCGAVRFEDWERSEWYNMKSLQDGNSSIIERVKVPDSCCRSPSKDCGRRTHPNNIFYSGCIYRLSEDVIFHLNIIGTSAACVSIFQIFGIILVIVLCANVSEVY